MRYLSEEWKAAQWKEFEETQLVGDTSDCGGWGWDPPCGGCARCMAMQFGHYLMKEEEAVRRLLEAGLSVADPRSINVPFCGDYHDTWRCYNAGERPAGRYPWEEV